MKAFCQNQCCKNPGGKVVRVSVRKGGEQTQAKPALSHLNRFLKKDGFVILTRNDGDPSRSGPFEAWAYRGPLDLEVATPVTFGVGASVHDAIDALEHQLQDAREHMSQDRQELQLSRHQSS
jgi:hypothetical protein